MKKKIIIKAGKSLSGNINYPNYWGSVAEIRNLISSYIGKNNPFYEAIDRVNSNSQYAIESLNSILDSFLRAVEKELVSNVSFERKLKIEVVNDYLAQAEILLDKAEYHPAISAFLIGASLEEFLRTWIIEQNLYSNISKPSIDTFALELKKQNLIDKQDYKEITSWAGIRNDAAHGNWDLVEERKKIYLMLLGVNLFIKKYTLQP